MMGILFDPDAVREIDAEIARRKFWQRVSVTLAVLLAAAVAVLGGFAWAEFSS